MHSYTFKQLHIQSHSHTVTQSDTQLQSYTVTQLQTYQGFGKACIGPDARLSSANPQVSKNYIYNKVESTMYIFLRICWFFANMPNFCQTFGQSGYTVIPLHKCTVKQLHNHTVSQSAKKYQNKQKKGRILTWLVATQSWTFSWSSYLLHILPDYLDRNINMCWILWQI